MWSQFLLTPGSQSVSLNTNVQSGPSTARTVRGFMPRKSVEGVLVPRSFHECFFLGPDFLRKVIIIYYYCYYLERQDRDTPMMANKNSTRDLLLRLLLDAAEVCTYVYFFML